MCFEFQPDTFITVDNGSRTITIDWEKKPLHCFKTCYYGSFKRKLSIFSYLNKMAFWLGKGYKTILKFQKSHRKSICSVLFRIFASLQLGTMLVKNSSTCISSESTIFQNIFSGHWSIWIFFLFGDLPLVTLLFVHGKYIGYTPVCAWYCVPSVMVQGQSPTSWFWRFKTWTFLKHRNQKITIT